MLLFVDFCCLFCFSYLEIFLVWNFWCFGGLIEVFVLDVVYLVIEGLFGWVVWCWLGKCGLDFILVIYMCFFEYLCDCCLWLLLFWGYVFLCIFY